MAGALRLQGELEAFGGLSQINAVHPNHEQESKRG